MRRIVYAVGGTAAGLATLMTLKAQTGTSAVSTTATGGTGAAATAGAAAGAGASGTGTVNGSGSTGSATGTGAATGTGGASGTGATKNAGGSTGGNTASGSSPAPGTTSGTQVISGNVANTAYGPVQIQLTVTSHRIVKVTILQQPTATAHDLQIGQFAFPQLEAETFSAQTAKINAVSGATYTSGGYIQSLQSAIDRGA
jgi:uncharacterized protein with FMN-binding domain